jgi:hypothetical protein
MKKILYMLLAVMMTAFTACREKDEVQHRIVGEWHFAEEEAGQQIEIYLAFNSNFTFDLYQKIGEGVHRHMTGTYQVDRTIVSGMYSDRTPWACDYDVSFNDGNMTMKSTSVENYVITYTKQRIPDEVRNNSVETRSETTDTLPFL